MKYWYGKCYEDYGLWDMMSCHVVGKMFSDVQDRRVRINIPEEIFTAVRMSYLPDIMTKIASNMKYFLA